MTTVHLTSNNSNNSNNAGATSPGWHFPKSGLGTPDLFYSFSGASSSSNLHHNAASSSINNAQQQQQPAWLRPSGNDTVDSSTNRNGRSPQASLLHSVKKEDEDGTDDAVVQQQANRNLSIPAQMSRASNGEATGNEEALRNTRALSDPPVRQSPAWIFPAATGMDGGGALRSHLEQEPNPFEHSFSSRPEHDPHSAHQHFRYAIAAGGGGGNEAGPSNNSNAYHFGYPAASALVGGSGGANKAGHSSIEIGPARRARSQSPKSAGWQYSGITAASFNNIHEAPGASATAAQGLHGQMQGNQKGVFANMSTPSSELPGFGWSFSNQASQGSNLFDPTSIRTGLTPGGHLSGHPKQDGVPHSPATQALFAMMTNATPGAEDGPYQSQKPSQAAQVHRGGLTVLGAAQHQQHQGAMAGTSRSSSSNNSSNSAQHVSQTYSQAVPRPMPSQGQFVPQTGGMPAGQQYQQNSQTDPSHSDSGNYLTQMRPRPLPPHATDSRHSSEASSSQSIPRIQQQQQQQQLGNDANPLYFLSQHAPQGGQGQQLPPNAVHVQNLPQFTGQQRVPSDPAVNTHNEDAMLAAAALSGLSTPRPVYVGGPAQMSSVNPGTISAAQPVPKLIQPPLGRQKQPPSALQHEQKPIQPKDYHTAAPSAKATGKRAVSNTSAGNKRKKASTATPPPSGAPDPNKKVRRTSRRTAASTSQQNLAEEAEDSPDELQMQQDEMDLGDSDDDMMSMNGSMDGSRDGFGGSQPGDGEGGSQPRKGGRGPKQHFATEEDKRKNFLERNRQAALKCRQRKKQWLTQLQAKVEYLTADNETLQSTVGHLRDEVSKLRTILGVHGDCPMNVPPGPTGPGGMTTVGAYMHNLQYQAGPSMQSQQSQHHQR